MKMLRLSKNIKDCHPREGGDPDNGFPTHFRRRTSSSPRKVLRALSASVKSFGNDTLLNNFLMIRQIGIVLVAMLFLAGCHNMENQPKVRALAKSKFFKDGISARPLVPGTIPLGFLRADEHLYTGKVQGRFVKSYPFPITKDVLLKGKERFNIFCAVCHNQTGTGDGMIVRRGFKKPPSYHEQRLRDIPVGYLFDVITNGFGDMPRASAELTPEERWAVVAYIRTLQLSQNIPFESLTESEQKKIIEQKEVESVPPHA